MIHNNRVRPPASIDSYHDCPEVVGAGVDIEDINCNVGIGPKIRLAEGKAQRVDGYRGHIG